MINVLLSNTPIGGPRGSGLGGDSRTVTDEHTLGRGNERARESAAAPSNTARQSSSVSPLSPQAILAIQEVDPEEPAAGKGDDAENTKSGSEGAASASEDSGSAGSTDEEAEPDGNAASGAAKGADEKSDEDGDGLDQAEEKQVKELQARDREVRAHEQAHARVGGAYASAPSYTFQQGPDGKRYAVGGEVSIDTSGERTPEATARKMQIVIRAATAPAEPSSQDLKVAQQARSQLSEAQAQMRMERAEELSGDDEEGGIVDPTASGEKATSSGEKPSKPGASDESSETESHAGGQDRASEQSSDGLLAANAYSNALAQFQQANDAAAASLFDLGAF